MLTSPMDGSLHSGSLNATTLWHIDAVEWAPSTASIASILPVWPMSGLGVTSKYRGDSAAYAEALKALGDGAMRDFRIVAGLDITRGALGGCPPHKKSPNRVSEQLFWFISVSGRNRVGTNRFRLDGGRASIPFYRATL